MEHSPVEPKRIEHAMGELEEDQKILNVLATHEWWVSVTGIFELCPLDHLPCEQVCHSLLLTQTCSCAKRIDLESIPHAKYLQPFHIWIFHCEVPGRLERELAVIMFRGAEHLHGPVAYLSPVLLRLSTCQQRRQIRALCEAGQLGGLTHINVSLSNSLLPSGLEACITRGDPIRCF